MSKIEALELQKKAQDKKYTFKCPHCGKALNALPFENSSLLTMVLASVPKETTFVFIRSNQFYKTQSGNDPLGILYCAPENKVPGWSTKKRVQGVVEIAKPISVINPTEVSKKQQIARPNVEMPSETLIVNTKKRKSDDNVKRTGPVFVTNLNEASLKKIRVDEDKLKKILDMHERFIGGRPPTSQTFEAQKKLYEFWTYVNADFHQRFGDLSE